MKSLVAMEDLLQEIRPKYLRPKHFIRMKGAKMSETEKDEFDTVRRQVCHFAVRAWNSNGGGLADLCCCWGVCVYAVI